MSVRYFGNKSERMFRLYARIYTLEAERDVLVRQRDELARQVEKAADREAVIVSRFGDNGPGAA